MMAAPTPSNKQAIALLGLAEEGISSTSSQEQSLEERSAASGVTPLKARPKTKAL